VNRLAYFLERLHGHAQRPCVVDGDSVHTYGQLLEEIERWQAELTRLRVEPATVVGVRADYSTVAIAAVLALCARRAVAAMIPIDADPAPYLSDAHAAATLNIATNGEYEFAAAAAPAPHPLLERLRASGDAGLILFTSGSTGRPKAALHSMERFLYKFDASRRALRTLAFLVFDHIAGLDTTFYTLASGGTLVLTRRRDPGAVLSVIQSQRVEVLPTSPSFLRMLCATRKIGEFDLASLKVITYGSEPMDPSTLARLNQLFPNAQISQKYGTTETGSPRTVSRGNASLWLKMTGEGFETKVVDHVLWIRSEGAILGYLNATSSVDEEGWYCTGDLVDVDGEWIRFRGRVVDLINVGGEKVAPAEVEQSILELDFVRDVVVQGEPHALLGQVVVASVALQDGDMEPSRAAGLIRQHCRQRLAPYKVPMKIQITDELAPTVRQKAQRKRRRD